jgi:hypothetical protein
MGVHGKLLVCPHAIVGADRKFREGVIEVDYARGNGSEAGGGVMVGA